MKLGNIDYFSLWRIGSEGDALKLRHRLEKLMIKAAHYFGFDSDMTLPIIENCSLAEAVSYYAKHLGLMDKKLGVSAITGTVGPLIARDRANNHVVLLLPLYNQKKFSVHDGNKEIRFITIEQLSHQFSDVVVLLAHHQSDSSLKRLQRFLRSLIPHHIVMIALMLLCIIVGMSVTLISWQSESAFSPSVLAITSISFLCFFIVQRYTFSLSSKNFTVGLAISCSWIYQKFFSSSKDFTGKISNAYFEQIVSRIFFDIRYYSLQRYAHICSYIFIVMIVIITWFFNVDLALVAIANVLGAFFIMRSLRVLIEKSEEQKNHAYEYTMYGLGALQASFSMLSGLHAEQALLQRINKYQLSYIKDNDRYELLSSLRFIVPLLCTVCFSLSLLVFLCVTNVHVSFSLMIAFLIKSALYGWCVAQWGIKELTNTVLSKKITDFSQQCEPESAGLKVAPLHMKGAILVDDVSFCYQKSSEPVIKRVHLSLEAGGCYQIIGPSGAGKSTLLQLLSGMIPTEGQIYFDGQDVRSLDSDQLRSHFGIVNQDVELFLGTIYDNIVCGRNGVDRDLEKLLMSHEIFDILLDKPLGLQSYVFHRARNLSRQEIITIALARALLKKPKILFMDEIFKGIDAAQQKLIVDFLNALSCTRIMVVHEPIKIGGVIIKIAQQQVKIVS